MDDRSYNEKRIDADVVSKQDSLRGLKSDMQRLEIQVNELRQKRDHELRLAEILGGDCGDLARRRDQL